MQRRVKVKKDRAMLENCSPVPALGRSYKLPPLKAYLKDGGGGEAVSSVPVSPSCREDFCANPQGSQTINDGKTDPPVTGEDR